MSLEAKVLQENLKSVFSSMMGNDEVFSSGVADAIADYAQKGIITTTDTGKISVGTFMGSGKGTITVDSSLLACTLLEATKTMSNMRDGGGDDYLAQELARGIENMMQAGRVICNVTGSAVNSSGSISVAETTIGTFSSTTVSVMQKAFSDAFNAMKHITREGDDYMASEIAKAVTSYFQRGIITTCGNGVLSGVTGTGRML